MSNEVGLKILEKKYALSATIQSTPEGSSLSSLGTVDKDKKLNLNMKFKGINFIQMMRDSKFNEFEVSGDSILSMNSHFEGISIPSSGKITSMKVVPLPLRKLDVDLYFRDADLLLSNVVFEYFEGYGTSLVRLTHKAIQFDFNHEKMEFNFTIKKLQRLKDLEEIIQFLLTLMMGEEPLVLYIKEDKREIELLQMSPLDNINTRNELLEIQELLVTLKDIQKYYQITFRDFNLNFSEDTIEKINLIKLHMNKNTVDIPSMTFTGMELLTKEDITSNQKQFYFKTKKRINTINLFNSEIKINEDLIFSCNDAYITKSIEQYNPQKEKNYLKVQVKSAKKGIKMGFFSEEDE
ncbi:hypothetical protein [Siminovitchia fordii]|uniref:Uncharacterized protein n=1 Tax=Siminovitchia fordii TaxID=254759 RepID=A0ABQ4K461_9BACI|nr:hypothetical protein [Siminovitchia fordii]GIN20530.1 hypothetical protein J1TS3_16640 [Siminovitchia fordii]